MADKKIALDLEINIKKGDMTLGELNKQLRDLGDYTSRRAKGYTYRVRKGAT
jgi:hypothetical protein